MKSPTVIAKTMNIPASETAEMPENARIVPAWFVKLVVGHLLATSVMAFAWGWNLTLSVTEIRLRLRTTDDNKLQLHDLTKRFQDHIADPNLHNAGLEPIKRDIQSLERRVDKLEQ